METSLNIVGYTCYFSSDERKWINKIHEYAKQNLGDVQIVAEPQENDGCIYAKIPSSWFNLAPKRKRNLTEEQKEELRERGKRLAEMGRKRRTEIAEKANRKDKKDE